MSILNTTGALAKEINANNYGEVISTFQTFCVDQFILSISKLYERLGRFQLKSIPAVLQYFEQNSEYLEITEPHLLNQQLTRLDLQIPDFVNQDKNTKNLMVHHKLTNHLPDINSNDALSTLKTIRDKKIAHPEDISAESLPGITWGEAEQLLIAPKDIMGIIGDGYLSTVYMLDDGGQ